MTDESQFVEAPTRPLTRLDCVDWVSFVVATMLALGGYVATLAPNVTLEFSGLFCSGAVYAGVAHPPGYPVWTIYSWLFAHGVPFSNIAWRVAVSSAVAAATACGLTAMMVSHGGRIVFVGSSCLTALQPKEQGLLRGVCGCVAGLVLAFSGAVWSKAVIVDVWALSLLMFVGVLWLLMRWVFRPDETRWLCAAFFLFGLLFTSNQEMVVALPGLVLVVMFAKPEVGRDVALIVTPLVAVVTARNHFSLWTSYPDMTNPPLCGAYSLVVLTAIGLAIVSRRVATEWKVALSCGLWFLMGFGLWFFAPVASMSNPPVNWGYSRTVEGALHLIGRGQYERAQPTSSWGVLCSQLWMCARFAAKDSGWLHFGLGSLVVLFIRGPGVIGRRWVQGLLAILLCVGPVMVSQLDPPPNPGGLEMLQPYFAPSYVILAVWLGLGLMLSGSLAARSSSRGRAD